MTFTDPVPPLVQVMFVLEAVGVTAVVEVKEREAVLVQPRASVTVTTYVPEDNPLTEAVVPITVVPFRQTYE
jgi:hypothetical protein